MSLIAAQGLTVRLGGATIIEAVDLAVDRAEIVTIVGPNGSGKSTLLKALIGAVPVAAGRTIRAPGLRIGYVPQRLHIDPSLPITAARFLGLPKAQPGPAIAEALQLAGAGRLAGQQLATLSGGQLQRVLLARALIDRPDLLMLDEPTQGLDQPASAAFYEVIEAARARTGCGVLLVSHDLHVVMSASDRVVCLNTHVCCAGRPEVVADAPAYRALFGEGTRGTLALYRHHHHGHTHDGLAPDSRAPEGPGDQPDDCPDHPPIQAGLGHDGQARQNPEPHRADARRPVAMAAGAGRGHAGCDHP